MIGQNRSQLPWNVAVSTELEKVTGEGEQPDKLTQTTGLMTPTGELEPQIAYTASEKGHVSCKGLVGLAGVH